MRPISISNLVLYDDEGNKYPINDDGINLTFRYDGTIECLAYSDTKVENPKKFYSAISCLIKNDIWNEQAKMLTIEGKWKIIYNHCGLCLECKEGIDIYESKL